MKKETGHRAVECELCPASARVKLLTISRTYTVIDRAMITSTDMWATKTSTRAMVRLFRTEGRRLSTVTRSSRICYLLQVRTTQDSARTTMVVSRLAGGRSTQLVLKQSRDYEITLWRRYAHLVVQIWKISMTQPTPADCTKTSDQWKTPRRQPLEVAARNLKLVWRTHVNRTLSDRCGRARGLVGPARKGKPMRCTSLAVSTPSMLTTR